VTPAVRPLALSSPLSRKACRVSNDSAW
jgi:hypothetical protein